MRESTSPTSSHWVFVPILNYKGWQLTCNSCRCGKDRYTESSHWLPPVPAVPKYCRKVTKQKQKTPKPTLLLSSFIADNFIRCQEKQKTQTLNNFTVIFGLRKMKNPASGMWEEFQRRHLRTAAVNLRFWQVTESVLLERKLFTEAASYFKQWAPHFYKKSFFFSSPLNTGFFKSASWVVS